MKQPLDNTIEPKEICPCTHMTNLISRRSDGSLKGLPKLYTDFHVMTCPQCKTALEGMRQVNEQVKQMAADEPKQGSKLDEEHWKEIEAGWDEADRQINK